MDLDGDLDNDGADFGLFKADFIAANSPAAFQALFGAVPEPSTIALISIGGLFLISVRHRGSEKHIEDQSRDGIRQGRSSY